MSITPMSPAINQQGWVQTWVTSQWKNRPIPGQFSAEINTPMPLAAAYTASKMAIEGFTGSLALELQAFNVRAKLVEPGYGPGTSFTQNTELSVQDLIPEAYAAFAEPIFAGYANPGPVTTAADVAEGVWRAANDSSGQLRFPAGPDAVALAQQA